MTLTRKWMPVIDEDKCSSNEYILKSLWKDLDLIVDLNYRMDTTALFSDVLLPAASYYEKSDISTTDCHSYVHPFNKVLDPLYDSKPDWEIFRDLAKKVAQLAAERKLAPYHDQQFDWHRDFTKTYDLWSGNGKFQQPEDGANFILDGSPETKGMPSSN